MYKIKYQNRSHCFMILENNISHGTLGAEVDGTRLVTRVEGAVDIALSVCCCSLGDDWLGGGAINWVDVVLIDVTDGCIFDTIVGCVSTTMFDEFTGFELYWDGCCCWDWT